MITHRSGKVEQEVHGKLLFLQFLVKIENKKAKKKKLSSTASADVLVLRQIIEPKQHEVKFVLFSLDFIPDPSLCILK